MSIGTDVDEHDLSEIQQQFRLYARELDDKHDRQERIIKISRDITIESKRIIYLLHTINNDSKKTKILKEAEKRLKVLCSKQFKNIARELVNQDPYLYIRAYTPGLQEFIEALTFYQYNELGSLKHWNEIQDLLKYKKTEIIQETNKQSNEITEIIEQDKSQIDNESVYTLLPPTEYFLGIGDLTGEVMRKCIMSVGAGDNNACFASCKFLREISTGFISIMQGGIAHYKELARKVYTLRQNVLKAEIVCYNITVRGNESTTWGLIDCTNASLEEDEGFC